MLDCTTYSVTRALPVASGKEMPLSRHTKVLLMMIQICYVLVVLIIG